MAPYGTRSMNAMFENVGQNSWMWSAALRGSCRVDSPPLP